MNEAQYLQMTWDTATPLTRQNGNYLTMGLISEVGEIADLRKRFEKGTPYETESMALEIGDVLWYLTRLADIHGYTMEQIRDLNAAKLRARQQAGTLGSRAGRTDPRSYGP